MAAGHWATPGAVRSRLTGSCLIAVFLAACAQRSPTLPASTAQAADPAPTAIISTIDFSASLSIGAHLDVRVAAEGTVVECVGSTNGSVTVSRDGGPMSTLANVQCPFLRLLAGDFELSSWSLSGAQSPSSTPVQTRLPTPLVVPFAVSTEIIVEPWMRALGQSSVYLVAETTAGQLAVFQPDGALLSLAAPQGDRWVKLQWVVTVGGLAFASRFADGAPVTLADAGFFGGMAVGDLASQGHDELVGLTHDPSLTGEAVYLAAGMESLFDDRTFRDLRVADLDGDGRVDIISNVYGSGCTLIGMNQGNGQYEFSAPQREDGTCIGGHGETMLIADFNEDGLLDIFIPTYERWDLLINQGNGTFQDVAIDRGIAYPNYAPHAEGSAAVDINLDGHVDIVTGSEVLLNDGTAHFTAVPNVYGEVRLADEGLYVADLDNDGIFDIVKHDPDGGPRVFWGVWDRQIVRALEGPASTLLMPSFLPSPPLWNGPVPVRDSYGLAVGDLTGNGLLDVVFGGGDTEGTGPRLCLQTAPRIFNCVHDSFPSGQAGFQDLVMITDLRGDGTNSLAARFSYAGGSEDFAAGLEIFTTRSFARTPAFAYQFDIRDSRQRRTLHGRSVTVTCTIGGKLLGLFAINGGNGYLTQGAYVLSAGSESCNEVDLRLYTGAGPRLIGRFSPGFHTVAVAP